MELQSWSLDRIKPYWRDLAADDETALEHVMSSLRQFGFRQPIVVDEDGTIVVGRRRFIAAQRLGWNEAPVHVARDLTPAQCRAYRVADNRSHDLFRWNDEALAAELRELQTDGCDLTALGFDAAAVAALMFDGPREGLTDPDEVPPLPAEAVTRRGDLWILGNHRLLCGDSSDRGDLERLLDGAKVQLVHSDPPYNVAVQPRSERAQAAGGESGASQPLRAKDRPLANDSMSPEAFDAMLLLWFGNMRHALEPGCSFYLWGGYANGENYPRALRAVGLKLSQVLVWLKEHPVLSRHDFNGNFELCYYGWVEGAKHRFFGPATSTDVWELSRAVEGSCQIGKGVRLEAADGTRLDVLPPRDDRKLRTVQVGDAGLSVCSFNSATDVWRVKKVPPQRMVHLTEKPTELAVRALSFSTLPGEAVLDLFGGSGSTVIGAEQMDRRAYAMELDPLYCDVIVERWEKFTGRKAELASR